MKPEAEEQSKTKARSSGVITVHVQSLDDDLQLDLVGHVAQGTHGHAQLLLGDVAVPIAVKHLEGLTDLCIGEVKADSEY